ncbi:MAG: efflux RND transporter permease subunit [Gammaproteobacteria bacterium]
MKSLIAWFVDNPVAANLIALVICVGGILQLFTLHKEEFPSIDTETISIQVPFPGAAPEEVENSVCVRIEEALEGIEGIKRVITTANEGSCAISVELLTGANKSKALDEVNSAVDGIDSFPVDTERPGIAEVTMKTTVMELVVSGNLDERSLKELAQSVRDELTELPGVSQVTLLYVRPYEVSIEVSEQTLRQFGLTLGAVAEAVRAGSADVPGGSVKTESGEVMLRAKGQRYVGTQFEDIPVIARADGTVVRLGEIATIVDGFEDTDLRARFDGEPAMALRIERVGDEDTLAIAERVKQYLSARQRELPPGARLQIWRDESLELVDRLDVLLANAAGGLALVLLTLALFLRFRIALWVAAGLPVAMLGAVLLFSKFGVSINSLSVMGLLLSIGILVDDAIVVGERVHARESQGEDPRTAAIEGTNEVAIPVFFGVLTTVAAFYPMLTLPGQMNAFFGAAGITVVLCLLFSLAESQLVLPAHLAHRGRGVSSAPWVRRWIGFQDRISAGLMRWAQGPYRRQLASALRWRYLVLAIAAAAFILTGGLIASGRLMFQFFPSVEGDRVYATLVMPEGAALAQTAMAARRLEDSARRLQAELDRDNPLDGGRSNFVHVLSSIGTSLGKGAIAFGQSSGSHIAEVGIELPHYHERNGLSSGEVAARWRELTGPISGVVQLGFSAQAFGVGMPVDVQLRGRDVAQLASAAAELRSTLAQYDGVMDIADTFRPGKQELTLRIRPEAELLGLSQRELGRQVRQAFYGEEAQRVQRGRDDVRVMVRFPESERVSLGNFEHMRIRAADGTEVPSLSVADANLGMGYATIHRIDGRRVVSVTADVDRSRVAPEEILGRLVEQDLPRLLEKYPGVSYALAGEAENRDESMSGLLNSTIIALLLIFALLAIPLRSYVQPLVIMSAIPFGIIGALLGHLIMGMDPVFFSLLGIVALSGVVVNSSLVLVDYINVQVRRGVPLEQAVMDAGVRRFRPIFLTSVTTCVGLGPLMATTNFATSMFVPMAVSMAFGVLFATVITLYLIPALCLILDDLRRLRAVPVAEQGEPPGLR